MPRTCPIATGPAIYRYPLNPRFPPLAYRFFPIGLLTICSLFFLQLEMQIIIINFIIDAPPF